MESTGSADPTQYRLGASKAYLLARNHSLFGKSEASVWLLNRLRNFGRAPTAQSLQDPITDDALEVLHATYLHLSSEENAERNRTHLRRCLDSLATHQLSNVIKSKTPATSLKRTSDQESEHQNGAAENDRLDLQLLPAAETVFLYCKYRFVVVLDVSPSMASLDADGNILFDKMLESFEAWLQAIVRPIEFPSFTFSPEIYVSVIAQASVSDKVKVLLQGVLVTTDNVGCILDYIESRFSKVETEMVSFYETWTKDTQAPSLQSAIQDGVFSLRLLPTDACPGLLLFTDGVSGLPYDCNMYDNMLMLLNRESITCSVVQVDAGAYPHCIFGYSTDTEGLRYLSNCTMGRIFDAKNLVNEAEASSKVAGSNEPDILSLQSKMLLLKVTAEKAHLITKFQGRSDNASDEIVTDTSILNSLTAINHPFPWVNFNVPLSIPLLKTKVRRYNLPQVEVSYLLDVRMREGFKVDEISGSEGKELDVRLLLLWQPNVFIGYNITHVRDSANATIDIEIVAYYEFLHQFTSIQKNKSNQGTSPYRIQIFLNTLIETDRTMSYLVSQIFSQHPSLEGVPSSSTSLEHQSKLFWKVISNVGNNNWHKWLKADKFELLLSPQLAGEHFEENSDSHADYRVGSKGLDFQFNNAMTHIEGILSSWANFGYEGRIYIKFLPNAGGPAGLSSPNFPSSSFCLLQLSWETTNMASIHLVFFGTSVGRRLKTIEDLKAVLTSDKTALDISRQFHAPWNCSLKPLVLHSKLIRPLLVTYNVSSNKHKPATSSAILELNEISHAPLYHFLSSYLFNRRNAWIVESTKTRDLIVELLIKSRLKEGFNIANAFGVYNLVKIIDMKASANSQSAISCVVQYVIYKAAPSFVVTEYWIEPQHKSSSMAFLPSAAEMEASILASDLKINSSLCTFDSLLLMLSPSKNKENEEPLEVEDLQSDVKQLTFQRPPFSISNIISSSKMTFCHEYNTFSLESKDGAIESPANLTLYSLLDNSLSLLSDGEIPLSPADEELGELKNCRCFGKNIHSSAIILAFLWPIGEKSSVFKVSFYECARGDVSFNKNKSTHPLRPVTSAATKRFCESIMRAHHRNFVKVAYSSLRDGSSVQSDDFARALELCQEYSIEIDGTRYVEVIQRRLSAGLNTNHAVTSEDKLLRSVNKLFKPTPFLSEHYFYAGKSEVATDVATQQEEPAEPPTFGGEWDEDDSEISESDDEDDTDYWNEEDMMQSKGQKIKPNNARLSPNDLNLGIDAKTPVGIYPFPFFLRLDCFATDAATSSTPEHSSHSTPSPAESPVYRLAAAASAISAPVTVTSLATLAKFCPIITPEDHGPQDQRVILRLSFAAISPNPEVSKEALSQSQLTLFCLRRLMNESAQSIRSLISEEILHSLRGIRPITKQTLDIVMHHMKTLPSRSLPSFIVTLSFLDIREGRKIFPNELEQSKDLNLSRIEDIYYVNRLRSPTSSGDFKESSPSVHLENGTQEPLPFWLLIIYKSEGAGDTVKVLFHADGSQIDRVEKSQIFSAVRAGIRRVCERVNQLLLLNQLHDTRICSPILCADISPSEVPDYAYDDFSSSRSKLMPSVYRHSLFAAGELACPSVHVLEFDLHPRVHAPKAIGALISTALHPFLVTNSKNLFVYREKNGRVFYLKISDSTSTAPGKANQSVVLEVFGLDVPGPEITQQLRQLLEGKLASIALSILSTMLERNPLMKLTKEDLDFIKGQSATPAKTLFFKLPEWIDFHRYLLFLKQNLLQFLTVMHASNLDTDSVLMSRTSSVAAELAHATTSSTEQNDPLADAYTFIYNYITAKLVSPVCNVIGQGIAIVRISHEKKGEEDQKEADNGKDLPWLEVCSTRVEAAESSDASDASHCVVIELWAQESLLNVKALVNQLTLSINQTLCEYALESYLNVRKLELSTLPEFLSSSRSLLSHAASLNAPSVQELTSQVSLPSWSLNDFIAEIVEILTELNPQLFPSTFITEDPTGSEYAPYVAAKGQQQNRFLTTKDRCSFAVIGGKLGEEVPNEEPKKEGEAEPKPTGPGSRFSLEDSMLYSHTKSSDPFRSVYRSCFVLIILTSFKITVFTYNWNHHKLEMLNGTLTRLKGWNAMRDHLLKNILHQKMGLFYHLPVLQNKNANDVVKYSLDSIDLLLNNASPARNSGSSPAPPAMRGTPAHLQINRGGPAQRRPPPAQHFDLVLANTFPIEPMQHSSIANIVDPVRRHGIQFKATASISGRLAEQKTNTLNIYHSWSRFSQSSSMPNSKKASPEHLRVIMRLSRQLSCLRIPFLFDKFYPSEQSNQFEPLLSYTTMPSKEQETKWSAALLKDFVKDFVRYLETIGFYGIDIDHQAITDPARSHVARELFSSSKPATAENLPNGEANPAPFTTLYLQKVLRDGLLVIKLNYVDGFVCCDLFSLHGLRSRISLANGMSDAYKHNRRLIRIFVEECSKFKQLIHLNSFSYDFHLQQFYYFLLKGSSMKEEEKYPPLQFIKLMQSIHKNYAQPPQFASNRLFSDTVSIQLGERFVITPYDIFHYISNHASSYSAQSMDDLGLKPAVFLLIKPNPQPENQFTFTFLDVATFNPNTLPDKYPIYVAMVFMVPETGKSKRSQLDLQFSVLRAHNVEPTAAAQSPNQRRFSPSASPSSRSPSIKNSPSLALSPSLSSSSSSSSSTSSDGGASAVATAIKNHLAEIASQAVLHFQRDAWWNTLLHAGGNSHGLTRDNNTSIGDIASLSASLSESAPLTPDQFLLLKGLIRRTPVQEIDKRLFPLIESLNVNCSWIALLTHLTSIYGRNVRRLTADRDIHFVIIPPSHGSLFFLHIVVDELANKGTIFSCCRFHKVTTDEQGMECDQVSNLVNCILHFLWKGLYPL
eukprot:TRINITY_DN5619_c0_g1_i2.p1 TRINITY_DN5619_c0_g1~~TRINITY_DN5619_c0_g1_i2.p1  ORF type:complete len:2863 (-),score=796.23 TRINITY_DN5619_c0_g1_i2:144-8732(-)